MIPEDASEEALQAIVTWLEDVQPGEEVDTSIQKGQPFRLDLIKKLIGTRRGSCFGGEKYNTNLKKQRGVGFWGIWGMEEMFTSIKTKITERKKN